MKLKSYEDIKQFIHPDKKNIKIIIKPIEEFYNYKYKKYWIRNQQFQNNPLRYYNWKMNMLWSEKVHFVNEVVEKKYFDTEYYGWCDIGYFRNRGSMDTNIRFLTRWPNNNKINRLNKNKIHYGLLNNNKRFIYSIYNQINNKNTNKLPRIPINPNIVCFSGGFFIVHCTKAKFWKELYDNKLKLYFENNYLVKDDQIIVLDCIVTKETLPHFIVYTENISEKSNWFMFQRILL